MSEALCTDRPAVTLLAVAGAIPLHRPWWKRAAGASHGVVQDWLMRWLRTRDQDRNERALSELDRRSLRDLGFGDLASPREAVMFQEPDRARW